MSPDILLLVPDRALALERLGGLRVLERQLFSLARAGARRVALGGDAPPLDGLRLPPALRVERGAGARPCPVRMSASHLLRQETLSSLLSGAFPCGVVDPDGREVLAPADLEGAARAASAQRLQRGSCVRVSSKPELRAALPWLLQGLRKGSDGFMARHFDRSLSLAVTRFLLKTPARPDQITVLSTLLGLAGATLFLLPGPGPLAGALGVWLHTVIDGCDGELARLTFRESRRGAWLDFWGDNAVHAALFACLALGLEGSRPLALPLGAAACLGSLGSAWLSWARIQGRASRPPSRPLAALARFLAQRDFVYLLVLAAALGRESWFLWAAGVGAPLYLALLLFLGARPRHASAAAAPYQEHARPKPVLSVSTHG